MNDFALVASGLDRADNLKKICGSGLDLIQFHWSRTGLGLKNFPVRSSLLLSRDEWNLVFLTPRPFRLRKVLLRIRSSAENHRNIQLRLRLDSA